MYFAQIPVNRALTSRSKYQLCISYEILTEIIHTAICLLDAGAGIRLVRSEMIRKEWGSCMKRNNHISLRTAMKQPLALASLIYRHICLGSSQTRMWYRVAPHLAVSLLLSSSFIYRFMLGIFPLKWKNVFWHSYTVAMLAYQRLSVAVTTNLLPLALKQDAMHKRTRDVFTTTIIRAARQIVVLSNTVAQVTVTTAASGLYLRKPRLQCSSRQKTLVVRGIMNEPPSTPFYATLRRLSDTLQRLPKHMVPTHTETLPPITYCCRRVSIKIRCYNNLR